MIILLSSFAIHNVGLDSSWATWIDSGLYDLQNMKFNYLLNFKPGDEDTEKQEGSGDEEPITESESDSDDEDDDRGKKGVL